MRIVLTLLLAALQINVSPTLNPSGAWRLDREASELPAEEDIGARADLVEPAEHLVIRMTQTTVTFYDRDGLRRLYRISGAKDQSDPRGGTDAGRARWDGAGLRIERKRGTGTKVVETYAVDPRTQRLTITIVTVRQGLSTGRRIRYVYVPLVPH